MWLQLSATQAVCTAALLAFSFVGSLYIWHHSRTVDRDHPRVIKQRFTSIAIVSVLSFFVVGFWRAPEVDLASVTVDGSSSAAASDAAAPLYDRNGPPFATWIGLTSERLVLALIVPLALTATLFAGSLLCEYLDAQYYQPHPIPRGSGSGGESAADDADRERGGAGGGAFAVVFARVGDWLLRVKNYFTEGLLDVAGDSASGGAPRSIFDVVPEDEGASGGAERVRVKKSRGLIRIRNLIVAPLCEELVFRACICSVMRAGGFDVFSTVLSSPLLFGLAHLHHYWDLVTAKGRGILEAVAEVSFQLLYTTLFGVYAGFVYLRTGHLSAAFLIHVFCNYVGFPRLDWLLDDADHKYPKRGVIGATFVCGLVSFVLLLVPLTDPALYNSWFYLMDQEAYKRPASPAASS